MSKSQSDTSLYRNGNRASISPLDVTGDRCPTCGGPKVVTQIPLSDGTQVRDVECPACRDLHNLARVSPADGARGEPGWQVYLFLIFVLLSGIALFTVLLPWLEGGR